jgi:hypothetical protein
LRGFSRWNRDLLDSLLKAHVTTEHEEQEQKKDTIDERHQVDIGVRVLKLKA